MATGTVAQLNFEVILNTKDFDDKIKAVENRAKQFNTSLSQSLDIQKSVEKVMNASAKASAKAASERAKEAQSFGKYVEQLRKMEEQGKRMAEQMPKAFNWTHPINQTYLELNRVMEVLQKIQERQASGARIQYSADYLNKITAQGEGALRAINALEAAQKRLTAKDNGFQEHIRSLTNTNMTLLQMREHYAALEKDTARAAKETEKMYGSQAKATKEVQKQVPIGRTVEGMASERSAIEKRIAENLANENKELSKLKTAEGTRASESKRVVDNQQKMNKLIEEATKRQEKHRKEVERINNSLVSARSILSTISQLTGVYFGAMGIRRFLSSMIEITGQFEVQKMALRNMLQDIDAADKIFEDLYRFSSDSTYRFSELAKYAKQLAAFNIPKEDLLETTKMLGDVASGVGVSMDRLINAYGHVKSSGFLRGIQLRSFSQNGVPVLEELSKILSEVEGKTVSLGDVFDKMMKRQIPFEMVEEAFKRMTSEGGKFYQMQEVLAKTLAGQINILKGRWENMLAAIGESNSGFLKGTVARLNDLVLNYEKLGKLLGELVITWGVYRAAVIATTLSTNWLTEVTNVGLLKALKNLGKWIMANPWAVLAAAVTLCTIEIIKASKELSDHEKIVKALSDVTDEYNQALDDEIAELDALFGALRNAREGTDEYASAKRALENRFDPYIQKLREEGVEVDNLATLYDGLAKKIIEANKQKFLEKAQDQITDAYHDATQNLNDRLTALMNNIGNLNADQRGALRHYLRTGEMTEYFKSIPNLDSRRTPGPYEGPSYNKENDNKTFREQLSALRLEYDRDTLAFSDAMADAAREFDAAIGATTGKTTGALKEWRRAVQTALYTLDDKFEKNFMPKEDEDYFEYLERMGKHYKEVNEYKDKALEKDKHIYQQELDAIKKIDNALEGNILSDVRYTREPWNSSSNGSNDPNSAARESLQADIRLLEKYKSIFDRRAAVFGEDSAAAWVFKNMGYDVKNLDKDLEKLIADLRDLGDDKSLDAAESIEASLGLDQTSKDIKAFNEAKKALEIYERALAKFDKDWGEGDSAGSLFKTEGILRKYTNEKKKIEDEWGELKEAAVKSNKEITQFEKDLYDARKKANENTMLEGLRGVVDDIFKDKFKGKELSDWSHKTLADIVGIKKAVKGMEIPSDIREMVLEKGGEKALKELKRAFDEYKQGLIEGTIDPEFFRKASKYAKQLAQYISKAGDAMKRLGDATNNANLTEAGEVISAIGQNLNAAAEGYEKTGSWIGAVVGGVVDIFNQVTDAVANANAKMKEMWNTIRNIRTDAFLLSQTSLFSNDGIFGTNQTRNIQGAVDAMRTLREHMQALGDPEIRRNLSFWEKMSLGWRFVYNRNHIGQEELPFQGKLTDVMARYGLNVYDQYDNLDPNSIREIIKLFGDEDGVLEQLAKDSEAYAEAMKVVESVAESLVGGVVGDLTDKIVDSWWEAGQAALDYADILGDVAKAYAKLIVNDMLLEAAFDPNRQEAFKEALRNGDTAKAMSIVEGAMQSAVDMLPAINSALQVLEPYRNPSGETESGAGSLGSGIKNITEETASLLASYVNAIRADVSYIRSMYESGFEGISAIGTALPTLNDYLAQIAATNFDIAQNTQSMLAEMRSVIGAPGTSGMVVRVETA